MIHPFILTSASTFARYPHREQWKLMANHRRLRWVGILGAWLFLSAALAHAAPRGGYEDGIYVYGIFKDAAKCPELLDRLKALPLRQTVILSLESGKEFVLDRPDGEDE